MQTPLSEIPPSSKTAQLSLFTGLTLKAAGLAVVLVLLPPLGRQMGFTDLQTGALMSISALAAMLAAPVWGVLTERLGRKPVLLIGLLALPICLLLMAGVIQLRLAGTLVVPVALALLFAVRVSQTSLVAGTIPAAQAYIADTTDRTRRIQGMGLLGAAFGLGAVIGSSLAWRVGGNWPAATFCLAAMAVLLGAMAVVFLLPETGKSNPVSRSQKSASLDLKLVAPNFLVTFLGVSLFSILQQTTALRFQDYYSYDPAQSITAAGGVLTATSLTMVFVQLVALKRLNWDPQQFVIRSALLGGIAMLCLGLAQDFATILISMALMGISLGLLFPGNLGAMSLVSGSGVQAKIAGINAIFQGLGMAIGPITGAVLNSASAIAVPAAGVGLCLSAAIVFWLRRKTYDN
ncbi:MFS transporter [Labrenzia sp. CE80]|uniref:MFS transporter n=1 Tax=Labrenzia sp. CE80 TaxID=1788986 RepID=UPI00129A8E8C|nr:MFS transporter [Labrenzia sp. CE80]